MPNYVNNFWRGNVEQMTISELFTDIYPIHTEELKKELLTSTQVKYLKKNVLLNRQGEYDSQICFLKSGIVGTYDVCTEGKHTYYCLCDRPGEIIVGGMGPNNMYSLVDIIMLTDVELFSIRFDLIKQMQNKYPEVTDFYNRILMNEYLIQWESKKMLYLDTPEERYKWFLENHPGAINTINHKVIASFLHMSPVTLSRVRNRDHTKVSHGKSSS